MRTVRNAGSTAKYGKIRKVREGTEGTESTEKIKVTLKYLEKELKEIQANKKAFEDEISKQQLTVKDLNIRPSRLEDILPSYIYRFRKYGQFA